MRIGIHTTAMVLGIVSFATLSSTFLWKSGRCPVVKPVKPFDIDKFIGVWYLQQSTERDRYCLAHRFRHTSSGIFFDIGKVQKHETGFENEEFDSRTLEFFTKETTYNLFEVQFDNSARYTYWYKTLMYLNQRQEFNIIETDYENFAVGYECGNREGFFSKHHAYIYSRSRKRVLDKHLMNWLKGRVIQYGLERKDFFDVHLDVPDCYADSSTAVIRTLEYLELTAKFGCILPDPGIPDPYRPGGKKKKKKDNLSTPTRNRNITVQNTGINQRGLKRFKLFNRRS